MNANRFRSMSWKLLAALAAGGAVFGLNCTSEQISAVVAGVGAAADQLGDSEDEDISFGDWIRDELDDL